MSFRPKTTAHVVALFLSHVEITSNPRQCWNWRGPFFAGRGYGQFKHRGSIVRAHRFSYELANGPLGEGLHVCHHCDNPKCVNPAHLFAGTAKENVADRVAKNRSADQSGEKNNHARLAANDVREIRRLTGMGRTYKEVATAFGVARTTVSLIASRKTWAHVQ